MLLVCLKVYANGEEERHRFRAEEFPAAPGGAPPTPSFEGRPE